MVGKFFQMVGLLCTSYAEQHVVAATDTLLCLELGCDKLVAYILDVTDAGEGHLLFDVVTEPVTANGIAKNWWDGRSEEQTAVEHRLERETTPEGERHSPVGTYLAHSCLLSDDGSFIVSHIELREVIGHIRVFGIETSTVCREVPVVFTVVFQLSAVADEMFILERHLYGILRPQLVAVVHVIPPHTELEVKMPQIEVDREQITLELVV